MSPNRYPSDLTDEEWAVVSKLFTKSEHRGAQRKHDLRRIIDGCLYVLRGGISEPRRVFRRPFVLSYAAMATSSVWA